MPQPVTRPRWVLFDAADTLIYAEPSVRDVYAQTARAHGHPPPTGAEIRERFPRALQAHFSAAESSEAIDRARWRAVVTEVLDTADEKLFHALWEHFARPDVWRVFSDVAPTWSALRQRGYRLAIASNFDARLRPIARALTPLNEAEHVFHSTQLGYRKPDARFFEAIAHRLHTSSEHLLLVGDQRSTDYRAALDAGWQAVLLNRNAKVPANDEISGLTELLNVLP